jgi:SAM-dependent methyltransferase
MNSNTVEMDALKVRLKNTWMAGDYAKFATYMYDAAVDFLADCAIEPGLRVLDVACGAGQTALPLARNGNRVTGVDIATNLVEAARGRAQAAGLDIQFDEGDAEALPYGDAAFDVVFSLFGAMFAPQPHKVAAELVRVSRPGGRIIMGNWTPGGFIGQMFKGMSGHVPPSPLMPPPTLWGDETAVRDRLGSVVSDLQLTRQMYPFKYPFSPAEVVKFFRINYGPTNRAFNALDEAGQAALQHDLEQLWANHNQATDGTTLVESEFLIVQAIARPMGTGQREVMKPLTRMSQLA